MYNKPVPDLSGKRLYRNSCSHYEQNHAHPEEDGVKIIWAKNLISIIRDSIKLQSIGIANNNKCHSRDSFIGLHMHIYTKHKSTSI